MKGPIHVINPNSSAHVTAAIEFAIQPFRKAGSAIVCVEMKDGPAGIQDEAGLYEAIGPMLRYAKQAESAAACFVIACFGDPGLHLMRECLDRPVFGIGECSILAAMARGQRFGIISLVESAIPRHMRWLGAMGVLGRLAQDRAMGLGVAELKDKSLMYERLADTAHKLRREDKADVIVLGGAAMSQLRERLERDVGIPVVDPNFAALVQADGVSKNT